MPDHVLALVWGALGATLAAAVVMVIVDSGRRRDLRGAMAGLGLLLTAALLTASLWVSSPHTEATSGTGLVQCNVDAVSSAYPLRSDATHAGCISGGRIRLWGGATLWLAALAATTMVAGRRRRAALRAGHHDIPVDRGTHAS